MRTTPQKPEVRTTELQRTEDGGQKSKTLNRKDAKVAKIFK